MKRAKLRLVPVLAFVIVLSLPACRKEAGTEKQIAASVAGEIDSEKIAADVGVRFRIIKTKALGESTRHKFYCVAVAEKPANPKLEELATAIVREMIAARPRTYHSFTVHFFWENELKETPEESTPFARVTYLPEGNWLRVGRASIEDYKDYRLTCVRLDIQ